MIQGGQLNIMQHVARIRVGDSVVRIVIKQENYKSPTNWTLSVFTQDPDGDNINKKTKYITRVQNNVITICWFDTNGIFYYGYITLSHVKGEWRTVYFSFSSCHNDDIHLEARGSFKLSDLEIEEDISDLL